jgi:DNA-directed RNA polymerase specialized sigma24 family protein
LDSLDLCQCVLLKLFDNLNRNEWTLQHPAQLIRLLQTLARNELIDQMRRQRARPRVAVTLGSSVQELDATAGDAESPSDIVDNHEVWCEIRARLRDDERNLFDQRLSKGQEWQAISLIAGEPPDALRKRLARGIDRAARELGLIEADDHDAT